MREAFRPDRQADTRSRFMRGERRFLIKDAISYGADVFITGEAKYNDFYDVEDRILLAVIGHYESEVCTKDIFYNIISKKFPTFAYIFRMLIQTR